MCVVRFNYAMPSAGTDYALDAIFMGVLNNGMSITGIDSNWQHAVKGLVLLASVVFAAVSKNRASGFRVFSGQSLRGEGKKTLKPLRGNSPGPRRASARRLL
jgi:ribose/xylose/arabinose/galactoside ABC-type transport system permease subunit